ncbi:MAG TPA: hypothetical protein VF758_04985 [Candidatus Acidoferrum sp.]
MRQASERGDFRTGHAFDEAENQDLAIGVWEGAYDVKNGVSLVAGVGSAVRGKRWRLALGDRAFFVERDVPFGAPVKIIGAIARDRSEPTREIRDIAERVQARESLKKDVLDEIFYLRQWNTRKQDAVDHPGVARIEKAEGGAVTLLRGADESVLGVAAFWRGAHGREAGVRG